MPSAGPLLMTVERVPDWERVGPTREHKRSLNCRIDITHEPRLNPVPCSAIITLLSMIRDSIYHQHYAVIYNSLADAPLPWQMLLFRVRRLSSVADASHPSPMFLFRGRCFASVAAFNLYRRPGEDHFLMSRAISRLVQS